MTTLSDHQGICLVGSILRPIVIWNPTHFVYDRRFYITTLAHNLFPILLLSQPMLNLLRRFVLMSALPCKHDDIVLWLERLIVHIDLLFWSVVPVKQEQGPQERV